MYKIVEKIIKNKEEYPVLSDFFPENKYKEEDEAFSSEIFEKLCMCEEENDKKFLVNHKELYDLQENYMKYFFKNNSLYNIIISKNNTNGYFDCDLNLQLFPIFMTKRKLLLLQEMCGKKIDKIQLAIALNYFYDRDSDYYKKNLKLKKYYIYSSTTYFVSPFIIGLLEEDDFFNLIMLFIRHKDTTNLKISSLRDELKKLLCINNDILKEKFNNFVKEYNNALSFEYHKIRIFDEYLFNNENRALLFLKDHSNDSIKKEEYIIFLKSILGLDIKEDIKDYNIDKKAFLLYYNKYDCDFYNFYYKTIFRDFNMRISDDFYCFIDNIKNVFKNIEVLKQDLSQEDVEEFLINIFTRFYSKLKLNLSVQKEILENLEDTCLKYTYLKDIIIAIFIINSSDKIENYSFFKIKSKNADIYKLCRAFNFKVKDIIKILLNEVI